MRHPTDRDPRASLGLRRCSIDDPTLRAFLPTDYPRVVNAVAMMGISYPEAEDAVQEALVRAWLMGDRGLTIERLDAWVAVVASNRARSGIRRLGAERRARARLSRAASDDPSSVDLELAADITRSLASLPRRPRQVAVLRYVLQLSTSETALALNVSEGTVKRALSDARKALVRGLAIDDEEVFADDSDR